jgi:hypothetical protein
MILRCRMVSPRYASFSTPHSDALPSIKATAVPSVPRASTPRQICRKRLLLKEKLSGLLLHDEWPIKDEATIFRQLPEYRLS